MAYDGIQYGNRVDNFGERKLAAKVVDTILNSATYGTRILGQAKPMSGKTFDTSLKVTDSAQGQYISGLEPLNSAASDTTLALSYAQAAFTQPVVSIMLESFSNSGDAQSIDLDRYKVEEGMAESISALGTVIFGLGTSNQPNGLGSIVDDATDVGTIGGQSRSTYSILNASRHAATSGILSLTVLATREDAITAAGMASEEPNLNLTTKTGWSLYEQLLSPTVRHDAESIGYGSIPLRGYGMMRSGDLKAGGGFTFLSYRGKAVIKDDKCTSGNWFMLNEGYIGAVGRSVVPSKYQGKLEKVSLGARSTMDGTSANYDMPSANGWFYQPEQMLANQAGMIARYFWIGQIYGTQFRRLGRETGITTV